MDPSPAPAHLLTRSEDQQRQTEEGRCKADGCANETCAEAEEPVWSLANTTNAGKGLGQECREGDF